MGGGVFMITNEMIISGIVSKIINDCIDISKDAIKRADISRKSKNQNFQTRMYQVIIDAINSFTFEQYKNKDILYDAANLLLTGFKCSGKVTDKNIGATLSVLGISVVNRKEFISVLYHEICKEKNFDVYKEVLLFLLQIIEYNSQDFRQINEKLQYITEKLDAKDNEKNIDIQDTRFQNNQRAEYAKKWLDVLFLHRNQPIEKQVRLCDIYVWLKYKDVDTNKKDNNLEVLVNDFIKGEAKRYLPVIILGDGGMGKSTLVSRICSKYENENALIVVRFKDLNCEVLNNSGIWSALENELQCKREDFRNKRLIIDGFDEAKINTNKDKLLVEFLMDAVNIRQLRVLITSRRNYVNISKYGFCRLLYLQTMHEDLVDAMCTKYAAAAKETIFEIKNHNNVIGIPFILYMILSLKLRVEKDTGICELYEKVFALNGGVYDRLYDDGMHWISNPGIKEQVHEISQKLAFAMFEKNKLELTENEYQKIVKNVNTYRINDFALANYYEIGNELSFIHKTIYEYFFLII